MGVSDDLIPRRMMAEAWQIASDDQRDFLVFTALLDMRELLVAIYDLEMLVRDEFSRRA